MGLSENGSVPNLKGALAEVYERTVMPLFLFIRNKNTRRRNYPSWGALQHPPEGFPTIYGLNISGVVVEDQYFFIRVFGGEQRHYQGYREDNGERRCSHSCLTVQAR